MRQRKTNVKEQEHEIETAKSSDQNENDVVQKPNRTMLNFSNLLELR